MEIIVKFDDKDIQKHTAEVVNILLQSADIKCPKESQQQEQQPEKEQQPQQEVPQQSKQEAETEYTLDYIRSLANEKAKSITNGKVIVIEIIKKYSSKGISSIKESDYSAFVQDLEAL